ncbi:MAG: hypothetical protein AAGC43_18610, partial [Bacteroidota bacterium]
LGYLYYTADKDFAFLPSISGRERTKTNPRKISYFLPSIYHTLPKRIIFRQWLGRFDDRARGTAMRDS